MKAEDFGRFQHISLPIANQKDKRAKSSQSQSSKQSPIYLFLDNCPTLIQSEYKLGVYEYQISLLVFTLT